MITFAPLARRDLAALVRYVTYVWTTTPAGVVQVSLPEPRQSVRPLSVVEREPPSLWPNSMMTQSPDATVFMRVVKRPSSV